MILEKSTDKSELFPIKLISNTSIANGVFVLSFSRMFDFIPGQMIAIAFNSQENSRLYSIASGNKSNTIDILYNVKNDGFLTPRLSLLKSGDIIFISKPFGSFLASEEPAYWIAAGTGIAPFASMMRSGYHFNKTLIHGGRKLENFYFQDEFQKEMPGEYIRCCSSENSDLVYPGRLTKYLENIESLALDHKYYLCGITEMVIETREILVKRGIPFEQIQSEIYF
ncbi:ferredoxin--NADP reductase [Bacteroidota bacterium]